MPCYEPPRENVGPSAAELRRVEGMLCGVMHAIYAAESDTRGLGSAVLARYDAVQAGVSRDELLAWFARHCAGEGAVRLWPLD
jgi:hypothetical protein